MSSRSPASAITMFHVSQIFFFDEFMFLIRHKSRPFSIILHFSFWQSDSVAVGGTFPPFPFSVVSHIHPERRKKEEVKAVL